MAAGLKFADACRPRPRLIQDCRLESCLLRLGDRPIAVQLEAACSGVVCERLRLRASLRVMVVSWWRAVPGSEVGRQGSASSGMSASYMSSQLAPWETVMGNDMDRSSLTLPAGYRDRGERQVDTGGRGETNGGDRGGDADRCGVDAARCETFCSAPGHKGSTWWST